MSGRRSGHVPRRVTARVGTDRRAGAPGRHDGGFAAASRAGVSAARASASVRTATGRVDPPPRAPARKAGSGTAASGDPAGGAASDGRPAATKAPAKKAPVKSAPAKKAPAKKAVTKAPAKKASAEKPPAKKAPVKSAPAKRAAGGASEWTRTELREVRKQLTDQLALMSRAYDSSLRDLDDLQRANGDGAGDDQADVGSKTFEREQEQSIAANRLDLLNQIERAVERIDSGTYGFCERCGKPIPKARLRAFPSATLDVACKQLEERR